MAYQSILNPMPVSIATMPSTPVTGTFWQATQPVSGTVTVGNASLAVTGTFFQATQPVSIATMPSTPVTGTFWQATQPVSIAATVAISAASLPLPTGAATNAILTGGTVTTRLTDGTNTVAVATGSIAASETAVDRLKVNASLRVLDTAQTAGSQLVAAKGDQTTGLWVNVKNTTVAVTQSGTWNIGTITTLPALVAGSAIIGALTANQSVNNAQVAGVATATGSGVVSAGVQRVVLATDVPLPSGAAPPATYSAAVVGLTVAATATDIFTLTGSATKTIRVSRILVNGVQTTAAQVNILLIRRSTADTLGTSTAQTAATYDTTNAAATATVLAYTANPTLGTTVGTASARRVFIPGAATASDAQGLEIVSGDVGQQLMTLRGIAQVLAVNLGGVTVVGGSLNITIEWTES